MNALIGEKITLILYQTITYETGMYYLMPVTRKEFEWIFPSSLRMREIQPTTR